MIKLENKPNVLAPTPTFPFGQSTNNTGTNNGFPLTAETLEDYHQFFAKLFDESQLVSNGLPDNAVNGFQMMEALFNVMPKKAIIEDTTILDTDSITITRAQIEAAFGVYNPFYHGFTQGTPDPLVDFQIQCWIKSGSTWRLLGAGVNGGTVGGVDYSINDTTGDISCTLYGAPFPSATPVRFILIG